MKVALVCLSMLLASTALAQRPEPPSVKHVICSAYSAMMAAVMHGRKLLDQAEKMGKNAESHAAIAIALDELEGLPAWATRDLISQLTANFNLRQRRRSRYWSSEANTMLIVPRLLTGFLKLSAK